ncbi:MAG: hypothetical protein Tsb008_11330 [Rhodothalassiaceae bacterium]
MTDSIRTRLGLAFEGLFGRRYGFFDLMEEAGAMPGIEAADAEILAFPARIARDRDEMPAAA